jgi:hypothetical protein
MAKEIQSEVYSKGPQPNQWHVEELEIKNYAKDVFGKIQQEVENQEDRQEKYTVQFSFVDFQPMISSEKLRRIINSNNTDELKEAIGYQLKIVDLTELNHQMLEMSGLASVDAEDIMIVRDII